MHDLRAVLRCAEGRDEALSAIILDGHTLQSSPESGARAGYDGAKRRKGPQAHLVVETRGHLLALGMTASSVQGRGTGGTRAGN